MPDDGRPRARCRLRTPHAVFFNNPDFDLDHAPDTGTVAGGGLLVVQSKLSGRDLRSVVNDIQARIAKNVTIAQGYHVEYGGQFESEAQASHQLLWLSLGVVVAIFFILSCAFGSPRDGLLIMLNLPLALIGGVLSVYLAGGVLSVASIVGFITLFGVSARRAPAGSGPAAMERR